MKKTFIVLLAFVLTTNLVFAQTLKTRKTKIDYGGYFSGHPSGDATFTYYEDKNANEIRHGSFNFVYADFSEIQKCNDKQSINFVANGTYKNGLKDGIWTYSCTNKNVFVGKNLFKSGTITLSATYTNGIPNGQWVFALNSTYKESVQHIGYLTLDPVQEKTIVNLTCNFNMGVLTGNLIYSSNIDGQTSKFNQKFDNTGYLIETIETTDKTSATITYENHFVKKRILKDFITGKSEVTDDFTSDFISYQTNPSYYSIKETYFPCDQYYWNRLLTDEITIKDVDSTPEFKGGYFKMLNKVEEITWSEYANQLGYKVSDIDYYKYVIDSRSNKDLTKDTTMFTEFIRLLSKDNGLIIIGSEKKKVTNYKDGITHTKSLIEIAKNQLSISNNKEMATQELENANQEYLKWLPFISNLNDSILNKCTELKINQSNDCNSEDCISSTKKWSYEGGGKWVYDLVIVNKQYANIMMSYVVLKKKYIEDKCQRTINLVKERKTVLENSYEKTKRRNAIDKELKELEVTDKNELKRYIDSFDTFYKIQEQYFKIVKSENIKDINKKLKGITDIEEIKKIIFAK